MPSLHSLVSFSSQYFSVSISCLILHRSYFKMNTFFKSELVIAANNVEDISRIMEDGRPRISFKCNGREVAAIVDIDSPVSYMSEKVASKMDLKIQPTKKVVNDFDGTPFEVIGSTVIQMEIGKSVFDQKFVVVEKPTAHFVLGQTFTNRYSSVRILYDQEDFSLKKLKKACE